MKAWHVGALAAAAVGGWAAWRVSKAKAAGVPWDLALKNWDVPVDQVAVKMAATRRQVVDAANGDRGERRRPYVLPATERAG